MGLSARNRKSLSVDPDDYRAADLNPLAEPSVDWRDAPRQPPPLTRRPERGGFDWGNFALGMIGGPDVAAALAQRRRAGEAAASAAEREGQRMESAGNLGFTKDEINAMTADDLSRVVREQAIARPAGSGFAKMPDDEDDEDGRPTIEGGYLYTPGGPGGRRNARNWSQLT